MRSKKHIEITVDTIRAWRIKRPGGGHGNWCPQCSAITSMVNPEDAAILSGSSPRAIYLKIEAATLHFTESPNGLLLICLNSLMNDT